MFSNKGIKYLFKHCDQEFSKRGNLTEHQRGIHLGFRYSCVQCGQQFSRKRNLAQHQRAAHEVPLQAMWPTIFIEELCF